MSWPCGQESHPKPECHLRRDAPRGERRGLRVLTAGLVPYFYRRYSTGPVASSQSESTREGFLALSLSCDAIEGREGLKTMTLTQHDLAARRRGERNRDRASLRLSPAIDAKRRLNARRAHGTRTKADPFGPSDPGHAHLTRSYD